MKVDTKARNLDGNPFYLIQQARKAERRKVWEEAADWVGKVSIQTSRDIPPHPIDVLEELSADFRAKAEE